MKKIIALLLACVMVLGLFAACGGEKAPAETKAPEAGAETPAEDGVVTVNWYTVGSGKAPNHDAWTKQVNDYLDSKGLGIHLNYENIAWGDWGERRSVIVQTGADWDMILCQGSEIVNDAAMGALAPIEDLMDTVPGLTELIPEAYFEACTIDGHLYGIPAYKDCAATNYWIWHKDTIEAAYPEWENLHTLADIEPALRAILEYDPGMTPLKLHKDGLWSLVACEYDAAGVGDCGIGIAYNGGTEFVSVYEEMQETFDLLGYYYSEGLINSDAPVAQAVEGIYGVSMGQGWPSAAETSWKREGDAVVVSQYLDTVLSTESVRGSVTAFNKNSKNLEAALKLCEFVNTDTYMRDLLWYGEEGVDWNYVDHPDGKDGKAVLRVDGNTWTGAAYTQGTFFTATPCQLADGSVDKMAEELLELEANVVTSPAMGFSFNNDGWQDTIAAIAACKAKYVNMYQTGADPSCIATMMAEMRDNGFDDLLAEVNRQFDEWQAAQG